MSGVVLRFDLSMVAISPRSMMSGESEEVRENVVLANVWRCFEIDIVFRKPKPWRRSISVSLICVGVHWRTVSTGRTRGVVDCGVSSCRRWLCPLRIWPRRRRSRRVAGSILCLFVMDVFLRPS